MAEKDTKEQKDSKPAKTERVARTSVKYDGVRYAPGQPVPFKSAKDAEGYDATGALEPK